MTIDTRLTEGAEAVRTSYSSVQIPAPPSESERALRLVDYRPTRTRTPAYRSALAFAVAALVAAAIGLVVVLAPFAAEEKPDVVDDLTRTTIEPDIAPTPADALGIPSDVDWSRVPSQPGLAPSGDFAFMTSVVVGGPGLIAGGADCPGKCTESRQRDTADLDAAIWTSTDGESWDRLALPAETVGGPADQVITGLVAWSGGYIAQGWQDDVASDGEYVTGPLMWTSVDGLDWTRLGQADIHAMFAGGYPNHFIPVDKGLVAIGGVELAEEQSEMAVWTSTDGRVWERLALEGDIPPGVTGAAYRDGIFIAVTPIDPPNDPSENPNSGLGVFRSTDGRIWTHVKPGDPVFGGGPIDREDPKHPTGGASTADDVFVTPGGFIVEGVAYGQVDRGLWVSPDGLDWIRIDDDDDRWTGGTHRTEAQGIVTEGDLFAILAWEGPLTHPSVGDNRYNMDLDHPATVKMDGVSFGGSLIAVGFDEDEPVVWIGDWHE